MQRHCPLNPSLCTESINLWQTSQGPFSETQQAQPSNKFNHSELDSVLDHAYSASVKPAPRLQVRNQGSKITREGNVSIKQTMLGGGGGVKFGGRCTTSDTWLLQHSPLYRKCKTWRFSFKSGAQEEGRRQAPSFTQKLLRFEKTTITNKIRCQVQEVRFGQELQHVYQLAAQTKLGGTTTTITNLTFRYFEHKGVNLHWTLLLLLQGNQVSFKERKLALDWSAALMGRSGREQVFRGDEGSEMQKAAPVPSGADTRVQEQSFTTTDMVRANSQDEAQRY